MTGTEEKLVLLGKKHISEELSDEEVLESVKNLIKLELILRDIRDKQIGGVKC